MVEKVVLVNELGDEVGEMEKLEAHKKGVLHKAFSVFILNEKGEMLLHQRAKEKYHCGGLWTNACCSHPRPQESNEDAVERKLLQEMGFRCDVKKLFEFTYKSELENGLTEHEYDHVYLGHYDKSPNPNPGEVSNWEYVSIEKIRKDITSNPEKYTPWFKLIFEQVVSYFEDPLPA